MNFASLHYTWVMISAILIVVAVWHWQNLRRKTLLSWISKEHWSVLIPEFSERKQKIRWILTAIGIFFVTLSLLRPQWGEHEEVIESKGMDILFALDLSNSMLAEDVNPSRLQRAQTFIKKTLLQLSDDRVGVIGFAGRSFLAVPLTTDFGYISEVVDSLNPTAILEQGTEIDEAMSVAVKAFERGGSDNRKTSRAIVLISDGEDYGKDPMKVATAIKEFGAGFFAFSVGTREGSPIPMRGENGVLQTYKKDRSGKTVLSRTNSDLLSRIASAADGKFFELSNTDDAAYILTKQLLSHHRNSTNEQRQVTRIDRYQYFLAIGILFLMIAFSVSHQRLFLLLALLFGGSLNHSAHADTFGGYWKNRRAVGEYEKGKFEDSVRVFDSAREADPDNSMIDFNHATALAKAKKDEDAIHHFGLTTKKALNDGDYATAAKSLYNEGLVHKQNQNFDEAFHQLTNAVEMAKISKQPDLEKKARQALLQASEQKQKKDQEKKDGGKGEGKDSEKKDQKKKEESPEENENGNRKQRPEEGKREFKSGTLSKEVAESIMNDLSDREKQLYQRKMKERKVREQQNEKDW